MSVTLTLLGVVGVLHLYRSQSHVIPLMVVTIQGVWVANASSSQWWPHIAVFALVAAHVYGFFATQRITQGES